MFSFFKKKSPPAAPEPAVTDGAQGAQPAAAPELPLPLGDVAPGAQAEAAPGQPLPSEASGGVIGWLRKSLGGGGASATPTEPATAPESTALDVAVPPPEPAPLDWSEPVETILVAPIADAEIDVAPLPALPADAGAAPDPLGAVVPAEDESPLLAPPQPDALAVPPFEPVALPEAADFVQVAPEDTVPTAAAVLAAHPLAPALEAAPAAPARSNWVDKLKAGLRKTGSSLTGVFTGTRIDEALYEELEAALLMADAGVKATTFLLDDLRQRVKAARATDPAQVKGLLIDALADLLQPLEKGLVIGEHTPTVIMVAGVNGAGKTTSIGKLTRHLAEADASVLLAAADTFRAAAREQLGVWATRNTVEIVGQQGSDPAAVSFDAVTAGKARGKDVVLIDTAGRLPTQLHLMQELKKIRRVIAKADATAPHEVLLVIDGNTGQNALAQVKAFDDALQLTGLVVTKLDGTAKGGVLAAIAQERPVPVYFIGVGEKLEDLQTFNAREFAQALLG